ncbi:MAG: PepSY domain-containing protein [Verrucomicrobiota bacterium]
MKNSTLRRTHRWIGLACALAVLAASGSGLLHVVMTWTQPPPPRASPATDIEPTALPPALRGPVGSARFATIQSVALRSVAGEPLWQVFADGAGTPRYFHTNGRPAPDADQAYALDIARRHLAATGLPPEAFTHTRVLTSFDSEYIVIFRLLPVHRVDVTDGRGTRLYVSTLTGSVARHTDDRRQFEAGVFSNLHKYAFIPHKGLRDALLVGFTSLAFLTSLGGVALFIATARRKS